MHDLFDERFGVERHRCYMAAKFRGSLQASSIRYTGYLNVIKDPISQVLLLILAHVLQLS